jgi:two-component sensor histidine kinase
VLYEIDDQRTVDVRRLLGLLAEQTKEGFAGERRDVRVIVDIVHRELPSDMAVPLSLFTVEALTNAFKHAFPDGRAGTIRVTFQEAGEGMLRLAIADDGVGFDESEIRASIGARLVTTFGQQIGGVSTIRAEVGRGTIAEIVFPDPERESAHESLS